MTWTAPPRVREIVSAVSERMGVPVEMIVAQNGVVGARKTDVINARWAVIVLIAADTKWSLKRIGNAIGRDHTTVLHALNQMGIAYESDEPRALGGRRTQAMLRDLRAIVKAERLARVERMKGWTPAALRRMREEASCSPTSTN